MTPARGGAGRPADAQPKVARPRPRPRLSAREQALLAAVGDPHRRTLLTILAERPAAGPTELAAEVPITRQAVSKHLSILERAGLVVSRRRGREILYRIRPARLLAAAAALARQAASWEHAVGRR